VVQYIFREDEPIKLKNAKIADAQKIGEELDRIRLARGGELRPADVVEAAKSSKNPLHQFFEWDDSVAAAQFRLDQARSVIRVVRVVDDELTEGSSRAFVSISSDRGVSYRAIDDIKKSTDLREAVLAAAQRDLEAFRRRYKELREICELVDKAVDAVKSRRTRKVESRASA
jgi:hypothetical protein